MFHMTFVLIGEFDWLLGRQKGSIFVKMFKNPLLRNQREPACIGALWSKMAKKPT